MSRVAHLYGQRVLRPDDVGKGFTGVVLRREAQGSQSLASGGLPRHQKGARKLPRAAELEGSEILVPVPIRHIRILGLPLGQFEQVVLGDPALFRTVSQVGPLSSSEAAPTGFSAFGVRRSSAAQDQSTELIHYSVLFLRIVLGKILLQPFKELTLSIRLAFQAKAHERGDRLAHAGVNRLGVSLHLARDGGRKADAIPWPGLAPAIRFRFVQTGSSATSWRVCFQLRHLASVCPSLHHFRNEGALGARPVRWPPHVRIDQTPCSAPRYVPQCPGTSGPLSEDDDRQSRRQIPPNVPFDSNWQFQPD